MTEERVTFDTGAERSDLSNVRYDLVSPIGLRRLAATYAEGARKYSDHNWRQGMPYSVLLNHIVNHIEAFRSGADTGEDDLAHAAWGLFALMEFEESHPEMDDRYRPVRDALASPAGRPRQSGCCSWCWCVSEEPGRQCPECLRERSCVDAQTEQLRDWE